MSASVKNSTNVNLSTKDSSNKRGENERKESKDLVKKIRL
jgi:hypothetical protein